MINLTRHWVAGPIQRWPCQVELTWWECQEWGRCPWWVMLQAWAACPWWGVLAWGACPWWGACLWWGLPQALGFQATPTPLSSWHGCSRCTPSTWLSTCSSKYQCSEILVCGVLLSYVVHLHTWPGVQKLDLLSHRFVRWLECVTCFPDLLFTCFPNSYCCLLVSLTCLCILLFTCFPDQSVHIVVYMFPWPVCSYYCLLVSLTCLFILLFTCFPDLLFTCFPDQSVHIVVSMFPWPVVYLFPWHCFLDLCSYCCLLSSLSVHIVVYIFPDLCSYCCLLVSLTCRFILLFTCFPDLRSYCCLHVSLPVCSYCCGPVCSYYCLLVFPTCVHVVVYLFPWRVCMLVFTCFPDLCVNISNHCLLISLTSVLLRIVAYTFPWHVCSNCCL